MKLKPVFVAALMGICLLFFASRSLAASTPFRRDSQILTRGAHRLTGTPESEAAIEHIAERLRAIGADKVIIQPFSTVQTRVKRCELTIMGAAKPLPLLPMRPSGIILPVTPAEGITGPLIHAGIGRAEDFSRSVRGAIVVLDYNAGEGWLRAFRLGAKAVIFVRNGITEAKHSHHVEANVNLPRFFYAGAGEDLPDGAPATIHSEVIWDRAVGRNIFAFFRGTDPLFGQGKEEIIILATNFDSYGEVPRLSPGARGAVNCAGLLRLAEYFQRNRPRRHLLLAFFDAQAQGHAGSRAFYRALETDYEKATVEIRQESWEAEKEFLEELKNLLKYPAPLEQNVPVRRHLLRYLRDQAAERTHAVADIMRDLRLEMQKLRQALDEGAEEHRLPPHPQTRIEEITNLLREKWQPEHEVWNSLRRVLGRDETRNLPVDIEDRLEIVIHDVRQETYLRREELQLEKQSLRADAALNDLIGEHWIVLHASLLLGDTTPRWGLIIGGDSSLRSAADLPGLYGKIQAAFRQGFNDLEARGMAPKNFVYASVDGTLPRTRALGGMPFLIHSGEIAGIFGIYNLVIGTIQERLAREGTPDDTLEHLHISRIKSQVDEIGQLLSRVANQEGLSLRRGIIAHQRYIVSGFEDDDVRGPTVMGVLPGTAMPNMPIPGAIVQLRLRESVALTHNQHKPFAFNDFLLARTNQNGVYEFGPVAGGGPWWRWDATRGFAAVFDQGGSVLAVSDLDSSRHIHIRLNVFRARSGVVVLPPQIRTERSPWERPLLLCARGNAVLESRRSFVEATDGVIGWYAEKQEERIKLFSPTWMVALGSGGEMLEEGEEVINPKGDGFSTEIWEPMITAQRSSADLWRLNESRIQLLRDKDILEDSLAKLHGRAEDLLLAARVEPSPVRREALAASAFQASQPISRKIRTLLDDLIFAVLILLALSVPFAFAMERVIIGATTIHKQVGWFLGFFFPTFLILYFSHPAFAIAHTPVIIFLGFAIVIMSSIVIFILSRKFEEELKFLQGMTSTVHTADVSRVSTFMAAMQMGISTMRRRPVRTALTATTVTLLTFAILFFASFSMQSGIVRLFLSPNPDYFGVWVRKVNWEPLDPNLVDVLQGRWGADAVICRRLWLSPQDLDDPGTLITRQDGTRPFTIRGLLGLEPEELQHRPDLLTLFGADFADRTILITESVARALAVQPGDTVILGGHFLQVGQLLDTVSLSIAEDMDGSNILPADFAQEGPATPEDLGGGIPAPSKWVTLPPDAVAVVSGRIAESLGAGLRGLMLYTTDATQATNIAENMAKMLPFPISATSPGGVYRQVLGTVLAASGVGDLFFPILLGGLVIFGTMLGSVTDREKEIYTFSALGLAPRHVATLFFAESMVYSLIGGMGGYLLAQATVRIMTILAGYGLVQAPAMNMSSTNTVVTILIVMVTVLVSAIYPAIKASRSANPGLLRRWRPPEPKGNIMDVIFPFTISEYDITGMVSFLREHFHNHADTGLGRFMAEDVQLVREKDGALGLDAILALAPFDLGVGQSFALRSTPSEIAGIDEIQVIFRRQSGQPKDWQRLNKVFLDDLRKQFLIWRSIPQEAMEAYRQRTLTAFGKLETSKREGTQQQ